MCGRYEVHSPVEEIARQFDATLIDPAEDLPPRYNVAPSLKVPVVRFRHERRELAALSWGLLPSWAKNPKMHRPINARAETLFDKPSFRNAIARRRCLIPADGFYEWQERASGKQPWHISMIDKRTFAFGGIWEYWAQADVLPVLSCAIIVTEANALLAKIHERMPVIIAREDYERWLDPELSDPTEIQKMLVPYPADEMQAYPVGLQINNARNEGPELATPAQIGE